MQKRDKIAAQPFLKFCGGKRQLLPEIRKHVPEKFGAYFEPFVGGGAVFFDLFASGRLKHGARLSDTNEELITTYRAVRDHVGLVAASLRLSEEEHSETYYYAVRAARPTAAHTRAARMIYLNRTCFNGLYRVNKKGEFNVPFGRYVNPTICDEAGLRACSRALAVAKVTCADFSLDVLADARRGDFAYFDPPYWPVSETANFTSYTKDGFSSDDQERLVECARKLKSRGVHVLLSNADLPQVRKLYKGFEMRRVEARRNINSKGEKRGRVGELLIW